MVALGAHMKDGFTLNELAQALRGMPRDARMLIRPPNGQLVGIDHVTAAHVTDGNAALSSGVSTHGTRYGVILVAADPANTRYDQ
jgi:hypothetical protein